MKKIKGKRIIIGIGIFVLLLIVVEVTLRAVWGFGKMPLYAANDKWEYMPLPNQSGVRLGNKYYYNPTPTPPAPATPTTPPTAPRMTTPAAPTTPPPPIAARPKPLTTSDHDHTRIPPPRAAA